jgi:hypothetical protein
MPLFLSTFKLQPDIIVEIKTNFITGNTSLKTWVNYEKCMADLYCSIGQFFYR